MLIGCDGIHSAIRHTLLETVAAKLEATQEEANLKQAERLRDSIEAKWSGTTCYRAVIPRAKLEAMNPNHRCFTRPTGVSLPFYIWSVIDAHSEI